MYNSDIIEQTKEYVEQKLNHEFSGHDWQHVCRVYKIAKYIAKKENANIFLVELAALLHDLSDWKLEHTENYICPNENTLFLKKIGVSSADIKSVQNIIDCVSFKGAQVADNHQSLESQIVQDADRLDAIGAIGIVRAITYGTFIKRKLHDPEIQPILHDSFDGYKNHTGTTINHFYEKLLLLKDRLQTETARQLAQSRHQFMLQFLERFKYEWSYCDSD